jgi:ribosomal protein S18 acetylase RimI-like enzyme
VTAVTHPLDNPVYASLTSHHADIARRIDDALRYPPDVAPFIGVGRSDRSATTAVERLVAAGDLVCFVGIVPPLGTAWRVEHAAPIAQMVRDAPLPVADGPDVVELASESQVADMLALTALVYPHYFRPRTIAMGGYIGIYEDGRLAAMAGERLHFDGHREISAVCTHPDFLGRGLARRLIALLTNRILERGERPFLHFSHDNTRAKALYERMGFRHRADVPLLVATRL